VVCPGRLPYVAAGGTQVSRALFAWIVGLTLALGSLDLHGNAVEHGSFAGTLVNEAACHPSQALHMEAPDLVFHPGCSACLLRLQTVGVAPPPPARLSSPSLETASPVSLASWRSAPVRPGGSPRAPPVPPALVAS
jgi:hypothetical protein